MRAWSLLLSFVLLSCASIKHREEQKILKNLFSQGKLDQALEYLDKTSFKEEEKNKVLFSMEKGLLLFEEGKYLESIEWLQKAQSFLDEHIKSLSKEFLAIFTSEYSKEFLGEHLERGLLNYYLSLAYLKLSQSVDLELSSRRQYLFSARAQILAWDQFFKSLSRESKDLLFPTDFLVKVYGAMVHESIGGTGEQEIAYHLYQDAIEAFDHFALLLPSYNSNYKECQLEKRDQKKCIANKTVLLQNTQKFLGEQILRLSAKIRPSKLSFWKKKFNDLQVSKEEDLSSFVFNIGLIPEKKPYPFRIPLFIGSHFGPFNYHSQYSDLSLRSFSGSILGLGSPYRYPGYGEYVLSHHYLHYNGAGAQVGFDLPVVVKNDRKILPDKALIYSFGGEKVQEMSLNLISPLGDLFRLNNDERVEKIAPKLAARFVAKHIAAIASAYSVYKSMSAGHRNSNHHNISNVFWAKTVAYTTYIAAVRLFEHLQQADTRYWSLLPQDVYAQKIKLEPGSYTVKLKWSNGKIQDLGAFEVHEKQGEVFSWRALPLQD